MLNNKTYMICLLFVLVFCSCKKFLQESPKGLITNTNFYQTDDDAITAVNAVYSAMRPDMALGLPGIYLTEMISDDGTMSPSATQVGERLELENMIYSSQHGIIKTVWTNAYVAINRANTVLKYVYDSSKIRPSIVRRVRGEACFLRAFNYFRLVQLYGDVPLVLTPSEIGISNLSPSRTPVRTVYNSIVSDLKYAEENLNDYYDYNNAKNGGRATSAAAKALLGKVYLTMAGYPLNDVIKYQLAADKLNEVILNKGSYNLDLNPSYSSIFSAATSTKAADKERIFYSRGTSGMAPDYQAFTRMKSTYMQFKYAVPSKDFLPYTTFASVDKYYPISGGTRLFSIEADDAITSAIPIGFSFNFGGVLYDSFYMSSNGFISFKSRSNAAPNISSATDPIVGPLMDNLNGTGGTANYLLSGAAPNRVLTIEWANWRWKTGTTVSNNISFQAQLYEDGRIQFNYNNSTPAVNSAASSIGVRYPNSYLAFKNTNTTGGFSWVASNTGYSSTVNKFQYNNGDSTTQLTIAQNLRSVYEVSDARRTYTTDFLGTVISKYSDAVNAGYNDNADDFIWLRYSDVLLMYAEALMEIGGTANLDIALATINSIRKAHGGTAIQDLTYSTQDDLRQKIRKERRRELAFEGHRWYDLKRWNVIVETIKANLSFQYNRPQSYYDFLNDNVKVLPIPYAELANNPNLTQNPGY